MQDYSIWQQLTREELDYKVRLLIGLRLIQRRRIWIRYKSESFAQIGHIVWKVKDRHTDIIRPSWEYKVTRAGELLLEILEWLTRRGVLPC